MPNNLPNDLPSTGVHRVRTIHQHADAVHRGLVLWRGKESDYLRGGNDALDAIDLAVAELN